MRYFYYRIYQQLKKVKSNDTPAFNALALLVLVQTINIATVLSLIKVFVKIEIGKQHVVIVGLAMSFLLLIIQFKTLFGKRAEICKQYENETKEERRRSTTYLLLYIVLSVVVFFAIGETLIR
ncbi:MAG: hypothetical protein CVU55_03030 [Deltaproteobacteria bacterium HGW-Deltaproteobacteria-13]|jgi:glucan phosphoethanolaminetransferase (alkaline phosphatase superfamily)|nr:MAG: hypothetical protein CVU55_03030 [Deltaproteobacteria bacterium HGW-Deltaproteobacteria-13]